MRFVFSLLAILTIFSSPALAAPCPYTPQKGSPERHAIMNALRAPIQNELRQRIIFVVNSLKVCGSWAALSVLPRQPGGKPVNYSQTRYREAIAEDIFDDGVYALLWRDQNGWKTLKYVIGATDYALPDWIRQYAAPQQILP